MKKVLIAALLFAPMLVSADQKKMQPGQWQITVNMEMTGMPFKMPPQTVSKCLKPEDIKEPKEMIQQNQKNKDCQISNVKQVGSTVSWTMVCKSAHGSGAGDGSMTYGPQSYTGTVHMKMTDPRGAQHEMTEHIDGHRTGACP